MLTFIPAHSVLEFQHHWLFFWDRRYCGIMLTFILAHFRKRIGGKHISSQIQGAEEVVVSSVKLQGEEEEVVNRAVLRCRNWINQY